MHHLRRVAIALFAFGLLIVSYTGAALATEDTPRISLGTDTSGKIPIEPNPTTPITVPPDQLIPIEPNPSTPISAPPDQQIPIPGAAHPHIPMTGDLTAGTPTIQNPDTPIPIAASPYHHVTTSTDGTTLTVAFAYAGGPAPTVTVGTGPDVFATQVTWSGSQQTNRPGRWVSRVPGLTPGTLYYYRLDNGSFSAFGSATTMYRDVVVDFYRVDVHTDGDSGPRGCGDFFVTFVANWDTAGSGQLCLDDGDRWTRFQMGDALGRFPYRDVKDASVPVQFWALDVDIPGQPSDCGGTRMTTCGDLAYGFRDWSTEEAGTTRRSLSVTGEGVNVTARAKVTVTYHH